MFSGDNTVYLIYALTAIAAVIVLVGRPLLRVPGAAVEWFASRVEQRLQTHTQAPPQPTDKKA